MSEPDAGELATRLVEKLRTALLVVAAAILLLDLPTLVAASSTYRPFALELAAYVTLFAVTAASVAVIRCRERPRRWRWVLILVALAANAAATAAVPSAQLFSSAHWSWDIYGWSVVPLMLGRPLRELLAVLAAHLGATFVQVLAAGRADQPTLDGMTISATAMGVLPVAAWLFGSVVQRIADNARLAATELERAHTIREVAASTHRARRRRYGDFSSSAGPLLARLARAEIQADSPGVQRAFFMEAARLRRIFAEADPTADPLAHEITACTDTAARRGIAVSFATCGRPSRAAPPIRRALADVVVQALALAGSQARVTVTNVAGRTTVTVVTDALTSPGDQRVPPSPAMAGVDVSWSKKETGLWAQASVEVPDRRAITR